ncbi:hypothetical protein INQ51_17065 [Maribellus sp. CM-23]|uniref:DNA methyltransferase n=1 Tax=Maribellus sp. CM-23 TaxID=2781026 RepID=UPI001F44CA43|nr:DNA methyltransferase [Maribellus sp. CM-23]MCE4566033.1 hypothetical protein [Maribellus sp. CM-23]
MSENYTWTRLSDVYSIPELTLNIEKLEKEFINYDETSLFSQLVNTSQSNKLPYHSWMRYREAYSGDLVKELLKRFPIDLKDFVIDPMCGSGSTMVACNDLGIKSIGLDVNPYAILSSKIKCASFDHNQLKKVNVIKGEIIHDAKSITITPNEFDTDIEKYFNQSNFRQVVALKQVVNNIEDLWLKDFFLFALLSILENCSNRKKDGNGLATRETKVTDCFAQFGNQINKMISDITSYPYPNGDLSKSLLESAKDLNHKRLFSNSTKNEVGSIIFSPPYANSFDYFESYKMELIFGEWSRANEIHNNRKTLIRNYRLGYGKDLNSNFPIVQLLREEIWKKIPLKESKTGKRDGRTRLVPNMLSAYFEDMAVVIENCMNLLKAKGYLHIVVDQSSYLGVPIPTDIIFAEIAQELGYNNIQIIKCRKANTSGQQLKQFPYLKQLLRESIVSVQKI